MFSRRLGVTLLLFPIVTMSASQTTDALSILSFYFILYGVLETAYAYSRTRKPDTLLIATGLALLGVGAIVTWFSFLYPTVYVLSLVQIIIREIGLMILFIPVLSYALGGARINGPV
jgi:RsiW-degrading membrane proteinase PrsW (M82 family)